MFDQFLESMTELPILARFAIALMVILTLPPLCERVRLPAVVGFLLAGVLFGPSGLHIAPKNSEVAHFFSELGKLLLMFFAGLEIDLTQFQRVRNRSLAYGMASFATPLVCGVALGRQAKNDAGAGLIDEPVLNSVLVLVVVTSVLGPVLTERFGKRMAAAARAATV